MKVKSFALFISICLAGCAHRSPAPAIENKAVNSVPLQPTLESNHSAIVLVTYHILDTASGQSGVYYSSGLIVSSHAIISDGISSEYFKPIVVNGVTVRSAAGEWSEIPALVSAHLPGDFGLTLLETSSELPARPIVFGKNTLGEKVKGYSFGSDGSLALPNVRKVAPAYAAVHLDGKRCDPGTNQDNSLGSNTWIIFDMNHRLLCFVFMPAQEIEHFLRDNRVSFFTD